MVPRRPNPEEELRWHREVDEDLRWVGRQIEEANRHAKTQALRRTQPPPGQRVPPPARPGWATGPGGPGPVGSGAAGLEDAVYAVTLPLVGVALLPLAIGHLAALVFAGGWPRYRLDDVPGIMGRLPTTLGDPAAAWEPVNRGTAPPGPVAWWGTAAVLVAVLGLVTWLVLRNRAGADDDEAGAGATWASPAEARPLHHGRARGHPAALGDALGDGRLVVGTGGHHRLALRDRHSLLVVGPALSGKTSGLIVPALLEWPGPAVVVTSKGHLVDETIGWRSRLGEVRVYDPAGATPHPRSGWSPLVGCASWAGAIRGAQDLAAAVHAAAGTSRDAEDLTGAGRGDLWRSSAALALAPFLFAAAVTGRPVHAVGDWARRDDDLDRPPLDPEVADILRGTSPAGSRSYQAMFQRRDPARAAYLRVVASALDVYDDPRVARSTGPTRPSPEELVSGRHTLYLTAPEGDQARFRPLHAMLLRQVVGAAYERATTHGPLDPPLLVVLDDAVGVAPLDDLAVVASTAAARGIQLVTVCQGLDVVERHYGPDARAVVDGHPAKLVLPDAYPAGAADMATATGEDGAPPGPRLLPAAWRRQLADGEAALLYGAGRPIRLRLRPWYLDRQLRRRSEAPRAVASDAGGGATPAGYTPVEQARAWLRRTDPLDRDPVAPGIPVDAAANAAVFGSADDDTPPLGTPAVRPP